MNLFDTPELSATKQSFTLSHLEEYPPDVKLAMEKEVTGLYVSGHPLMQYRETAKQLGTVELEEFSSEEDSGLLLQTRGK